MPQDCRVASRTPKFGTAHSSRCQPHTCVPLHNSMLHQILYLNFEKGFKHTTHTELTSEQCHYSWLRQLFGCESNMLVSTLSLRHIIKYYCIKKQSPTWKFPMLVYAPRFLKIRSSTTLTLCRITPVVITQCLCKQVVSSHWADSLQIWREIRESQVTNLRGVCSNTRRIMKW